MVRRTVMGEFERAEEVRRDVIEDMGHQEVMLWRCIEDEDGPNLQEQALLVWSVESDVI